MILFAAGFTFKNNIHFVWTGGGTDNFLMKKWDSSDILMYVQELFGADPDASRWASRLQLSCELQVKVLRNRCLLLLPEETK